MKIVFDGRMIGMREGIPRYAEEILKYIAKSKGQNELILLIQKSVNLDDSLARLLNETGAAVHKIDVPVRSLKEQALIPQILKELDAGFYFLPNFHAPVHCPCPMIFTIHDVIHLLYPEHFLKKWRNWFYYKHYVVRAAKNALCVITVSETSRSDIVRLLKIPQEKIKISSNGISEIFHQVRESATEPPLNKPYIVTVSNPKWHKNTITLVRAYQKLISSGRWDGGLVLIGRQNSEVIAASERSGGKIHIPGAIDDLTMAKWIKHSTLFVFPSLYEGFGLPPVEAMACGTPVIASDCPALMEVLGDAALYFPAKDDSALADIICATVKNETLLKKLKTVGITHAKKYNWNAAGEKVWLIINEYINNKK